MNLMHTVNHKEAELLAGPVFVIRCTLSSGNLISQSSEFGDLLANFVFYGPPGDMGLVVLISPAFIIVFEATALFSSLGAKSHQLSWPPLASEAAWWHLT